MRRIPAKIIVDGIALRWFGKLEQGEHIDALSLDADSCDQYRRDWTIFTQVHSAHTAHTSNS